MFELFFLAKSGFEHHVAPRIEKPLAHFPVCFGGALAGRFIGGAARDQKEFVATDHDGVGEV